MDAERFWQEVKGEERDSGFKVVVVELPDKRRFPIGDVYSDWEKHQIVIELGEETT